MTHTIRLRWAARSLQPPLAACRHQADTLGRRAFSSSSYLRSSGARLRFAPSPTGFLHLGGLRTALFNHLYARALGGKWILRIEDTDQTRLVPGSVVALQETLEWAKLDYDEGPSAGGSRGPYIQSERLDLYRSYAERLIASGKAYRDFRIEVVDPTAIRRKAASIREDYIPPDEAEAKHLISLGKPYVVRLHVEPTAFVHTDQVYGELTFPADPNRDGTDDPILLKSNGWPTYHLANVVDDHEMGITHVLRGEEWLPSLPRHIWLYRALGLEPPQFAHLPLLVNADGTKLSKRTGDVKVESYRDRGIEPEALNNLLALMSYNNTAYHSDPKQDASGKSQKDENAYDVLTMQEMINGFDVQHVNRSRATVDMGKLYYLNSRHLNLKIEDREGGGCKELIDKARPKLVESYPEHEERFRNDDVVHQIIVLCKGTSATLYDIPESARPLFYRPDFSVETVQALYQANSLVHLHFTAAVKEALAQFSSDDAWTHDSVHQVIARLPESLNKKAESVPARERIKKASILAPLRFAISAAQKGAPLADLLLFLGREESLNRLQLALQAHERGLLHLQS